METATPTSLAQAAQSTPAQGSINSPGAGITGGYTGDSLSLKIIMGFLIGLSLYNALELLVLIFVTFQRYSGLYFWSLIIAGLGILPYGLGFLIKFFQLLEPNDSIGYLAVVLLTVGWYMMITGQSVVLWSRLHLITNSTRILRCTLYMIIIDAILLHSITTVLTFGSNSTDLDHRTLMHFVHGYNIMEKIQMVMFFIQEVILSAIYIKETIRLLKLSASTPDDIGNFEGGPDGHLSAREVRKTMYQLLAINVIIIMMDCALLGVEFANLYIIETTLKGVVYSIKLKLEFAVLGKLVQLVRAKSGSGEHEQRIAFTGLTLENSKSETASGRDRSSSGCNGSLTARNGSANGCTANGRIGSLQQQFPDFVDPTQLNSDVTHAEFAKLERGEGLSRAESRDGWRRTGTRRDRNSWIEEEMDKHNIG
ncbi:hypothetical protein CC78DRAFT_269167 [Lojkania enalia]|uniref:DUF7703 domain-containing protein n=1 Tax=Lojkania enalia TaxID=147567 RepID=A0A9P4K9A2_9PLEO|nr:hypothetical protein CC78DRAFT_269167 [Didymosphaeria enalia]